MHHVRHELALDPRVQFFLATNDRREEAALRAEFGARLHAYPKESLNRGDARAGRDAMVDLYCLAGCRKLLGSQHSSFTDTAAAIRGISLTIVRAPQPAVND